MLERMAYLIVKRESFAFETTLSGLAYLKLLREAKDGGYTFTFFYVWLQSFRLSIERVARRVSKGGHHIPADVIERRYTKSIKNFEKYAALADEWYAYNNSGTAYRLIAKFTNGNIEISDTVIYNKLMPHD